MPFQIMSKTELHELASALAAKRLELERQVNRYRLAVQRAVETIVPQITRLAEECREQEAALLAAVEAEPESFERPRSMAVNGVKYGYRSVGGGITYGDPQEVVRLIEERLPDMAQDLLCVVKSPNKTAIKQLPASILRKIGCGLDEKHDQAFVATSGTDLDRLVKAIIAEGRGQ